MLNGDIVADMEEVQVCRTTASQELTVSVLVHPKTILFGHRGKQPSIHAELLLVSKLFAIRLRRRCPRGGQHIIDVEYLLALLKTPPSLIHEEIERLLKV
jgi:hypothetical protein